MLRKNILWKTILPFRWKLKPLWQKINKRTSSYTYCYVIVVLVLILSTHVVDGNVLNNRENYVYKENNEEDENYKNQSFSTAGDQVKNFRSVTKSNASSLEHLLEFDPNPVDNLVNNHRKTKFTRNSTLNENLYFVNTDVHKSDNEERELCSSWAIKIPETFFYENSILDPNEIVLNIANELGLISHGTIGHLQGHYMLTHHSFYNHSPIVNDELALFRNHITSKLTNHPDIDWVQHEVVRKRYKRSLEFKDQFFPSQWHLDNLKFIGHDINVTGIWEHNITGKGVTVSVIDDGVEWTNPDILDNYSSAGSWDLNSNDADPMPRVDEAGLNHHGTRCAGEIAAVANEYCAVGVAFGAKVSGIRILDGPMTDSLEAMAFNTRSNVNDVYSCSWGPDDNGRTVDGPHQLAQAALAKGVLTGRRGYGSIFVVASGNGGHFKDNCNFDGYANSIFTVTIGAVDELGQMPYYAEQCAAMLAVTYSSGQGHQRNIVTTDWRLGSGTGCTDRHTGTSAAAPLAAGVIALMLEARSCLTWRDIQHLIVYTSVKVDIDPEEWQVNGAGFAHSHKHGFGLLDSWRLVTASKIWPSVPFMTSWSSAIVKSGDKIPTAPGFNLTKTFTVKDKMAEHVVTLEHVTITVNVKHPSRGTLAVRMISPSGTVSRLASTRKYDKSSEGFVDWTFSTVRCWGETPRGKWKIIFVDRGINKVRGILKSWRLTFYGSSLTKKDIETRKRLVKKAISGRFLRHPGPPCSSPPAPTPKKEMLSPRMLKIILLLGGFFFLVGIYFVLETLCNNEEKDVKVVEADYESMEIMTPDGFDMDAFVTGKLAKDDEERLTNIIEHGSSRPMTPTFTSLSITDADSLEVLNANTAMETPDEMTRVHEFEERLKFALEQSLILQMKQMNQIDSLEKDLKELMGDEGLGSVDVFSETPAKKKTKKKKLKGILKKPKQYKD